MVHVINKKYTKMEKITQFNGDYKFLSNFYTCFVPIRGVEFTSLENAYQASKAADYGLDRIFSKLSPGQSKKLGRNILMRDDWEEIKLEVMESLLRIKFKDEILRARLVDTGNKEILEGNAWGDVFWGVTWDTLEGENNLGKILMRLREEYKNKKT